MARNAALFGRQQVHYQRQFVVGLTATKPVYVESDTSGNKEFAVDVLLEPQEGVEPNVVKGAIIAPYAKELVTDIRQPVTLERSRQGQYTVIGRAKVMASGTVGDVDDPTYSLSLHNYADLGLRFIPDLDWELEPFQADPGDQFQADPEEPFQAVRAFDAFDRQVVGPEVAEEPPELVARRCRVDRVRQVVPTLAKFGPKGDPLAMDWGVSVFQPTFNEIIEQEVETCQ